MIKIIKRFTYSQIPIDILRLIVNKSLRLPIIVLVNGHSQIGKSTFIQYLANRILQVKNGVPLKRAKWDMWNYKKYCTTTPQDFVEIYDSAEDQVLAMEEAGQQMNYLSWFGIMSRVFNSVSRTQGLKRNICLLVTPHAQDIVKHNRDLVDFRIWVRKRIDERRIAIVRPRYVKIDYLKDKYKLGWLRDWTIKYPSNFLTYSKGFTDHLANYKVDIMTKNKELVGLIKPKSQKQKLADEFKEEMQEPSGFEEYTPIKLKRKLF